MKTFISERENGHDARERIELAGGNNGDHAGENEEIERYLEISLDRRKRRRDGACGGCGHGPQYDANTRGGGSFRAALWVAANPLMAAHDAGSGHSGGNFAGGA